MNNNSYLCRYLQEHADWRSSLPEKYDINIKESGNLAIFNYGIRADFKQPLVQEARGIILYTDTFDVACFPFRKFGKYLESYADNIDWSTAQVQEKIDGSLLKLWFNKRTEEWVLSTNKSIYAKSAMVDQEIGLTYYNLFEKADNFESVNKFEKNPDITYMFEIVSPYNQVVIPYKTTHLYHIGARNNITGEELQLDLGVDRPKTYSAHSLEACIEMANMANSVDGITRDILQEGFVVVDVNWHRIKVKSPDYSMIHNLAAGGSFPKERLVDLLRKDAIDIQSMCDCFPEYAHYFKYYDFKVTEFRYKVKAFCEMAERFYKRHNGDRKALDARIRNHRYKSLAFQWLRFDGSVEQMLQSLKIKHYSGYISDYEPEKYNSLFREETEG